MPAARAASAVKFLSVFIEGYFERLQKFDVLRRHFQLRLHRLFFERLLIHLDVKRFQEAPVLGRHFRVRSLAACQTDRRVQLEHDIESSGADAGDGFGDPLRVRNTVVDRVAHFPKELLHAVVELQSGTSYPPAVSYTNFRPRTTPKQAHAAPHDSSR